jgi:hypothetical protein
MSDAWPCWPRSAPNSTGYTQSAGRIGGGRHAQAGWPPVAGGQPLSPAAILDRIGVAGRALLDTLGSFWISFWIATFMAVGAVTIVFVVLG